MSTSAVVALINYQSRDKNCAASNFDLMINFAFFWRNSFGIAHCISVTFGLWTFHKLWKRQKKFDFIDFWLPYLLQNWQSPLHNLYYCIYKNFNTNFSISCSSVKALVSYSSSADSRVLVLTLSLSVYYLLLSISITNFMSKSQACPHRWAALDETQSHRSGGFGALIPPNKAPSPPNWNMKYYKSVEFLSSFKMWSPAAQK